MKVSSVCQGVLLLVLTGCGSQPVAVDQAVVLQADEGVAAVVMDAPDRISKIQFTPRFPGGSKFEVPDTQGGPSLYLVPEKAGRYCLQHFTYHGGRVESQEDLGCFTVIAGHITYSGDIEPELQNYSEGNSTTIFTKNVHNLAQFRELLKANYPKLAAAYPLAAAAPPPAGIDPPSADDEIGSWMQQDDKDRTYTIYVQNNTAWNMKLTRFRLYDCENLAQACDDKKLDLSLAPFETRKVLTVGPADAHASYNFRYQYWHEEAD